MLNQTTNELLDRAALARGEYRRAYEKLHAVEEELLAYSNLYEVHFEMPRLELHEKEQADREAAYAAIARMREATTREEER